MGTRSGDMDPAIIEFICQKENISRYSEMTTILNKKSGAAWIFQVYQMIIRDLVEAAQKVAIRMRSMR